MSLSVKDAMTLDLERRRFKYAGAKDAAIRDLFSESPTRYYQRLNAVIDSAAAWEHDPALVKRLRRLREARLSARRTSR